MKRVSERKVERGQQIVKENFKTLLSMIPDHPDWKINWSRIEGCRELHPLIMKMRETGQNPVWHGEGDVWTHTKMVCEELAGMRDFRQLAPGQRRDVFLAALLHDIGKVPCTKLEGGVLVSPNHTVVGAKMARELLWEDYGLCGTKEYRNIRETVCNLVRYHSVPTHVLDLEDPERRLLKIASNGELATDFSLELLCLLAEADVRGRICTSLQESLETVRLCLETAGDAQCRERPYAFPSSFSQHAYLSGRKVARGQGLYDDTWGEILLLSGLPGTGKDTWLSKYRSSLPVISLDDLRMEMKISPSGNQGRVVMEARERAKEYLRRKLPFAWNATCLTPAIREKQIELFENYHAAVRVIFLETGWEEGQRRNQERPDIVPETVVRRMLGSLVPPERFEAQNVEWHSV